MKKAFMLVWVMIALLPVAHASLDIERIRIEVNEQTEEREASDGDEFNVERSDKVKVTVYYKNDYPWEVDVRIEGEIEWIKDNDDDLEDETSWRGLDSGEDSRQSLEYTIPSNADYDEYDMNLRVKYRNATGGEVFLGQWNYSFVVDVREPEEDPIPETSINEVLSNMTDSCHGIAQATQTCFGYVEDYDKCSTDLSTVAEERGQFKQKSEDCEGTLSMVREETAQCNRDKTSLENQIKGMKSVDQCEADTAKEVTEARSEAASQNSRTIGTMALLAAGFWWFQNRKKKKASVQTSYDADYMDKG